MTNLHMKQTIWRSAACLLALLLVLGTIAAPVLAQTYRFSVPQALTDVYVNEDGTVSLAYTYVFQNDRSADPIDIVDIGLPTSSYDLGSVSATINGQPVQRIAESQFVDPGVEIHLGSNSIQPGEQGTLEVFIGTVERMLFRGEAQDDEGYASFQFQPNFFDSQFVSGQTDMTVTLHLPPGLTEEEPRYFTPEGWPGSEEPLASYDAEDRVTYQWNTPNADISRMYVFGAAFPARMVPAATVLVPTSSSDFNFSFSSLCPFLFCLAFGGFIVLTIIAGIRAERKRRLEYFPPRAAVEGNGIKRGLTSVEAALVMTQPMDKILTMILFSVIKKGAAKVVAKEPMQIEATVPQPEGLQPYEVQFIQAMALPRNQQRNGLQDMMTALVKTVAEKMRGFSRKETIAYYQDIMKKAWQQVQSAQTPELKMSAFDQGMDWAMLDKDFNNTSKEVLGPGPVILPPWWGSYDPTFRPPTTTASMPRPQAQPTISTPSSGGNTPPTGMSLPSLPGADFAASVVGGMQTFANTVVGDVTAFTGGVTQKTNPPPKPTTPPRSGGSRGGGGGRSCACACACAGCACACAGGGR